MRQCGGCTLCCKLIGIDELNKPHGQRCKHQRSGKGCAVYPRRPISCRLWNCRWLAEDDTAGLRRPDRVHYVIDVMPDYVTQERTTGERVAIEVVQIWVDKDFPLAYRDPDLMRFIERRAAEGRAAIIRFAGTDDAIVLAAPAMSDNGKWNEVKSEHDPNRSYDLLNVAAVLSGVEPP